MVFWIDRVYLARNVPIPYRAKTFNEMQRAMRAIYSRYHDPNKVKRAKAYLGLYELRQLIDHEMAFNICIENSEQHQAIWCIGRTTAVRPGSIGSVRYRPGHLQWRDCQFTTTEVPGEFTVSINFRHLKTNLTDPEKVDDSRSLLCVLKAPTADNIIFSPAIRLLVIALRRGILQDVSTVDELLSTKLRNIRVCSPFFLLLMMHNLPFID